MDYLCGRLVYYDGLRSAIEPLPLSIGSPHPLFATEIPNDFASTDSDRIE